MRFKTFLLFNALLFMACQPQPEPISYGLDACHFCRMTIVDRQHASELVTTKGRVYKFDAIECMLNYQKEVDTGKVAMYLCNTYGNPGELIEVSGVTFLISKGIPSPMGAFLTAFKDHMEAERALSEHKGTLLSWAELLKMPDSLASVEDQ